MLTQKFELDPKTDPVHPILLELAILFEEIKKENSKLEKEKQADDSSNVSPFKGAIFRVRESELY